MGESYGTYLKNGWDVTVARSQEDIEALRPVWEQMQAKEPRPIIDADIDRFLSVIESSNGSAQPYIILIKQNGLPVAMVLASMGKNPIKLKLGYKTFFSPTLRCLGVVYGGILGQLDNDLCQLIIRELMRVLRQRRLDAVYFDRLRIDSPLYQIAREMPGVLSRGYFPKIESHWTMSVLENIEVFFQRCSKKHRGNLKRCVRKLEDEYPGQVKLISYHRDNEVEDAIRAASEISFKTYQHAIEKGLKDDPRTLHLMRSAARHGWLQADILFVCDRPCAFQFGLKYQGVYHLDQIGFDLAWNQFNVGTMLFLKVLENLCNNPKVDTIDFGFGDAEYKRSYGDKHWYEAKVYLFAPRFRPICINLLQSAFEGLSSGISYLTNKVSLTGWLKRRWRRLLTERNRKDYA